MSRLYSIRYLILSAVLLLAGSLAFALPLNDQLAPDNGSDPEQNTQISYRYTSKVSGETITITPNMELYLAADGPPEAPSTIIMDGGSLFFEDPAESHFEDVFNFGGSLLTDEVLASFDVQGDNGHISYHGAELNSISSIPEVTSNLIVHFEASWIRNRSLLLNINGGTLTALNTIFEADEPALYAQDGSEVELDGCIFLTAASAALLLDDCYCQITGSMFLTNSVGIQIWDDCILDVTTTLFQGNEIALQAGTGNSLVNIHHSAFWGNWELDLVNQSQGSIHAQMNYWSLGESCTVGEVYVDDPLPETPCEPEQLSDDPITIVPIPPLADGDEPLMWNDAGKYVDSGLPVRPTYRIYRSTDPYEVWHPDNLILMTYDNHWRDPDPPEGCAFYCVTYAVNR